MSEALKVAEIFGEDVFNDTVMQERLPKKVYKDLKKIIEEGKELDLATADVIAHEMKEWAIEKGATHYTHWFQPLTGATAEKHDSFISAPLPNGKVLMSFSGKELIKGEPDASSFPSGGLRATFEARGYTAWDCTSPAFVRHDAAGATLCIPTAFCSYKGEALDQKTPLLRSMQAINEQSLRLLRLFGNTTAKKVIPSVGPEQEYFLVDAEKFMQRKDLIYTGRTLFGAMPPKGQELDDHYFGTIRQRIAGFMKNVNEELWRVGVSAKTQHNEVAPAQHELAPIYAECNVAVDHNQLTMEIMKKVADRHGLVCLIHEKPFEGVNGSGKHDNWSLATDTGKNLFQPGSTPSQNFQFLLFLAAFVKGVDEYQGLLRASVASSGNDHRLGAQEAPPAVISIFLGDELTQVVHALLEGTDHVDLGKRVLDMGLAALPHIRQDNTDRNRTSPMAFTGNKFEFRMVGSSDSVSGANIVLNAMMAQELEGFADRLEGAEDFPAALAALLKETFQVHQRILFDGNGYDESWVQEAQARGLLDLPTTPDALPELVTEKAIALFQRHGIYAPEEVEARYHVYVDKYVQEILIEARTMVDMVQRDILPACSGYVSDLCRRAQAEQAMGLSAIYETTAARQAGEHIAALQTAYQALQAAIQATPAQGELAMVFCRDSLLPQMDKAAADALEGIVDRARWPFPTYVDLLFSEG